MGAMYQKLTAALLVGLAACAPNKSLGSASFTYQAGFESGCTRAYVEAKPPPGRLKI
jgi:hypothetical protein